MVGVSRQAVSKTLIQADQAVKETMMDAAKSYKINVYRINHERGTLSGYSKALNSPVLVTYSPDRGLHVWYKHTGLCADCELEAECRETVIGEADRLGIPPGTLVPKGMDLHTCPPALIAERLFEIIFPKGERP